VWLFTIAALDFAFVAVIQFHLNANFNNQYARNFTEHLDQFNRIKKQLNSRLKRQLSVNSTLTRNNQFQQSINLNNCNNNESFNGNQSQQHQPVQRQKLNSINSFNSNISRNINLDDFSPDMQTNSAQPTQLAHPTILKQTSLNPLILVNNYPDNEFNSYLDELNMFEFENERKKKLKGQATAELNEKNVFCSSLRIKYTIWFTIFMACLFVLPQFFAYEIKQSQVGVSTTQISSKFINSDDIKLYESIYFIKEEIKEDKPVFQTASSNQIQQQPNEAKTGIVSPSSLAYSTRMSQAYAIAVEFNEAVNRSKTLMQLQTSHSKFFTLAGVFDLASKRYDLCNSIRDEYHPIRRNSFNLYALIAAENQLNLTWRENEIEIMNMTLICIRKNPQINDNLTYNTLYFWFMHTLVISVPICIVTVCLIAIVYTFLYAKKLSIKQSKTRNKFNKLYKIFVETSNLNRMQQQLTQQQQQIQQNQQLMRQSLLEVQETPRVQETDIIETDQQCLTSSMKKRYRGAKFVQIKDDLNIEQFSNNSPVDDVFETDDLNFGELGELLEQQINTENQVKQKQTDHEMLNVMFILDLLLYVVLSFPYTFMRLVLDLFVKDRIKINLDFYILFKLSFLLFNFHLILKFFIMVVFNIKFRICLCKVFAFKPKFCCIDENLLQTDGRFQTVTNNCFMNIHSNHANGAGITQNVNKKRKNCDNDSDPFDEEKNYFHSTEFDSNLHQYNCPADPNTDQIFAK